jgi:hypothetical protein
MMTVEACFYLPGPHTINLWFLKQLLNMQKKAIKSDKVKVLYVPQYETLSIEEIMTWVLGHWPAIVQYLPDERDRHMLPRQ